MHSGIGTISRIFSWSSWWVFGCLFGIVWGPCGWGGGCGTEGWGVQPGFWGHHARRCMISRGLKGRFSGWGEVLFRLLGTCFLVTHSHGFSRSWERSDSGAFVALAICHCHHGNCSIGCTLFSILLSLCSALLSFFLIRTGNIFGHHVSQSERWKLWGILRILSTAFAQSLCSCCHCNIMAGLFLCGQLTLVGKVLFGGQRLFSLSLDLLLQWFF